MTSISAAAQIRCVSAVRGSRTALGRPRSASLASRKSRAAARIRRDTTTRAAIEDGQMVTVHYVMTFPDGEVGDDTRKRDSPITLPIGQGQLFPKLEEGIKSMEVGEKKTFELACADVYGERKEEAVQKLPATPEELEQLKEQVQPGQMVQLPNGATALCVSLDEDGIVLDQNHPLAGRDLTLAIELLEVSSGPELFGVPIVPFDVNKVIESK